MLKISGKSISGMVTIGPLKIFRHQEFDIVQTTVDRPKLKWLVLILQETQPAPKWSSSIRKPYPM